MQRWRKAFWVWLMVLVLPLSGLAATGLPCAGGPAPLGGPAAEVPACHEGSTAAVAPAEAEAKADGDAESHLCSACAACFTSAAMPVTLPAFSAAPAGRTDEAAATLQAAGAFLGGLERPPRAAV